MAIYQQQHAGIRCAPQASYPSLYVLIVISDARCICRAVAWYLMCVCAVLLLARVFDIISTLVLLFLMFWCLFCILFSFDSTLHTPHFGDNGICYFITCNPTCLTSTCRNSHTYLFFILKHACICCLAAFCCCCNDNH